MKKKELKNFEQFTAVDDTDLIFGKSAKAGKFGFFSATLLGGKGYACRRWKIGYASPTGEAVGNIDYLREYVLAELAQKRMDINKAWRTYTFIIKEIGYYYAPFIEQFKENLDPIMKMGAKILQEMDAILDNPTLDKDTKDRYQTEQENLMLDYDYLF